MWMKLRLIGMRIMKVITLQITHNHIILLLLWILTIGFLLFLRPTNKNASSSPCFDHFAFNLWKEQPSIKLLSMLDTMINLSTPHFNRRSNNSIKYAKKLQFTKWTFKSHDWVDSTVGSCLLQSSGMMRWQSRVDHFPSPTTICEGTKGSQKCYFSLNKIK